MEKLRKRKNAAERKAEIVDRVIDLSAELGPDRVTTQHLADAIGVTQPAIFRHFATKAEIWEAVSERIETLVDDSFEAGSETPKDSGSLADHVRSYFELVTRLPALPSILHSRELQAEHEVVRIRFREVMQDRRERIAAMIKSGQDKGLHRLDIAAHEASAMVMAATQGLCLHWTLENRTFDLLEEGEQLIQTILDTLRQP